MIFPRTLLYTRNHTWIQMGDNEAKVGITDYAQSQLEDIVHIDIERLGKALKQNELFGKIESVKKSFDLFMPVSGKIIEINSKVVANPELVNKSPYFDGWIVKIKGKNSKEQSGLLLQWNYKKFIGIKE